MQFSWDSDKDESNQVKHGLSFETAKKVFDDPFHSSTQDRYVEGEARWKTIGMVGGVVLLLVAHTWTDDGEDEQVVRIISARRANAHERKRYEDENS